MEILFWTSVLLVAYVYAGYPLLLATWSAVAGRPVRKRPAADATGWPSVSIIVAARNEGPRLRDRILNLQRQVYSRPLEIIIVSDGSTDSTRSSMEIGSEGIGLRCSGRGDRVRLIELPIGGKPLALNTGVAASSGEIIVFADARQRFAHDAVLQLVSNFADPQVGGVTGQLILDCELDADPSDSTIADGVGLYWRYEKWLRRHESRVRSTLGATGAIYALRRELWTPLPADTLLDDVLAPMRVVLDGRRIVFEESARAFDRVAHTGSAESRRKTRTLAGNYQILWLEPRLLVPFLNPVWLQYLSHKIGRLLVPWALLGVFVASVTLAPHRWFYSLALILQLGFYGLAALGAWIESTDRSATERADERSRSSHEGASQPRRRLPRVSDGTRVKAG